jgi:hypothetical protein
MATWMAPVEGTTPRAGVEIEPTLDGPVAELDPWMVLDARVWPGASPSLRDTIPVASPGTIQPSTGSLEPEHTTPRICDVIAAWRAAERRMTELVQDDPDRDRLQAELVGFRALHHGLFEARMRHWPTGASCRGTFAIMAWGRLPPRARVLA